jgi:hypothetical protein
MDDFEVRRDALFESVAADQRLPVSAIAGSLGRYGESVLRYFIAAHDAGGDDAFQAAYRLIDLLGNMQCADLAVPAPTQIDPVVVTGRAGDKPFRVTIGRDDLSLDRESLTRRLKKQLNVERATRAAAAVRPAEKAPRAAKATVGVKGKLEEVPLAAVLEMLAGSQRTGVLHVRGEGAAGVPTQGYIGFENGEAVDAYVAGMKGDSAFKMLAELKQGDFRFATDPPGRRTLTRSASELLDAAADRRGR